MRPLAYVVATFPALTEAFIAREVEELANRGYTIHIFAGARADAALDQFPSVKNRVIVHYQPRLVSFTAIRALFVMAMKYPNRFFSSLLLVIRKNQSDPWEMLKILKNVPCAAHFAMLTMELGIGHVHAHFAYMPSSIALIISRLSGAHFSFSAHAWDIYVRPVMLLEKMAAARFIVTCSDFNRRFLSGYSNGRYDDKLNRIYHGLEMTRFVGAKRAGDDARAGPAGRWNLLAVGRLVPKKGFLYLVEACHILRLKGHDIACTIVGEGRQERTLAAAIRSRGLEGIVVLKKFVWPRELIEYYRDADVFVMPSVVADDGDRDALPNVLIEAMAMEIPVVATGVSAIPEVVDHGRTGLLVPERDPAMIAAAVETLLGDAELRTRITTAGRKRVEESFDITKNIVPLMNLFERGADLSECPWHPQ